MTKKGLANCREALGLSVAITKVAENLKEIGHRVDKNSVPKYVTIEVMSISDSLLTELIMELEKVLRKTEDCGDEEAIANVRIILSTAKETVDKYLR